MIIYLQMIETDAQNVSSVYQNKIEYVTPQQVDLTPDISFSFDSETVIDAFLRVYSSSTDNKTLFVLSNLSSTIIDQFKEIEQGNLCATINLAFVLGYIST